MGGKPKSSIKDRNQVLAWSVLVLVIAWLLFNLPKSDQRADKSKGTEPASISAETSAPGPAASGGERIEVVAELLNLRSEPSGERRAVVGTLRKGQTAEVLEKTPGWLRVKLDDGRSGYVSDQEKYVRFVGP